MARKAPTITIWIISVVRAAVALRSTGLIDTMKHDLFTVTEKTFPRVIGVHRLKEPAVVLYYKASDPKAKDFIDNVYNEVGKELNGMAKIAGVDCNQWKTFCEKQEINNDLTVVIYPLVPFPTIVYDGAMEKKPMVDAIVRHIPGQHIVTLSEAANATAVNTFLTVNSNVPRVLLFSDKADAPVLYKAVSNAFHDRMTFGFVNSTETGLIKRFDVKKFPTILLLKGELRVGSKGEMYKGDIKFKPLHEWLNIRSETFVKGGGYSSDVRAETGKPWFMDEFPEFTKASHYDICLHHKALCAILVLPGGPPDEATRKMIAEVAAQSKGNQSPAFKFMWVDSNIEVAFVEAVGHERGAASFLILNPHRRLRYISLPSKTEPTEELIRNLIKSISETNPRFINIAEQKLPPFAVRSQNESDTPKQKGKNRKDEL